MLCNLRLISIGSDLRQLKPHAPERRGARRLWIERVIVSQGISTTRFWLEKKNGGCQFKRKAKQGVFFLVLELLVGAEQKVILYNLTCGAFRFIKPLFSSEK